jgi:Zn-dependent protease with chaperone function
MYRWIVFLHVFAAFGFIFGHGASGAVLFQIRRERQSEKLRILLGMSFTLSNFAYISLLVMLIAGVILGFMGHWWGKGWIWLAIGTLVVMSVLMGVFAYRMNQLRWAVGAPSPAFKEPPPEDIAPAEEIERLLRRTKPWPITVIGVVGWGFVLWLMMFKPF